MSKLFVVTGLVACLGCQDAGSGKAGHNQTSDVPPANGVTSVTVYVRSADFGPSIGTDAALLAGAKVTPESVGSSGLETGDPAAVTTTTVNGMTALRFDAKSESYYSIELPALNVAVPGTTGAALLLPPLPAGPGVSFVIDRTSVMAAHLTVLAGAQVDSLPPLATLLLARAVVLTADYGVPADLSEGGQIVSDLGEALATAAATTEAAGGNPTAMRDAARASFAQAHLSTRLDHVIGAKNYWTDLPLADGAASGFTSDDVVAATALLKAKGDAADAAYVLADGLASAVGARLVLAQVAQKDPDTAAALAYAIQFEIAKVALLSPAAARDLVVRALENDSALTSPTSGGQPPGLYLDVVNGLVNLSSSSQNFAAGQFGFEATVQAPPTVTPVDNAITFPPPAILPANGSTPTSTSTSKLGPPGSPSNPVDCVVRLDLTGPTLAQCVAMPSTAGCDAVLPSLATCIETPTTPGCGAVLPSQATCQVTSDAVGCPALQTLLADCTANPNFDISCIDILPPTATATSTATATATPTSTPTSTPSPTPADGDPFNEISPTYYPTMGSGSSPTSDSWGTGAPKADASEATKKLYCN